MSTSPVRAAEELEAFAAGIAHELRTPLAALAGEVDVALRRERSAADYRDALSRIAASVAELVDLTGDLTLLGQPGDPDALAANCAHPDRILGRVRERYSSTPGLTFDIEPAFGDVEVVGDEGLLTRAVTLVVEHAVRHRRGAARLAVRGIRLHDSSTGDRQVHVMVEGAADAFWPHTWQCLGPAPQHGGAPALNTGPLRLRTAERIITRSGGSLHANAAAGSVGVDIRLPLARS